MAIPEVDGEFPDRLSAQILKIEQGAAPRRAAAQAFLEAAAHGWGRGKDVA